jgi:hypothetical protein
MRNANICRFCGREIQANPYLGDTNPEHVRAIRDPDMPSVEILHAEDRVYDTFCSKEHYIRWLKAERHRLPDPPPHTGGPCPGE